MYYVDGSNNVVIVSKCFDAKVDGEPIWVARLLTEPRKGYVMSSALDVVPFGTEDHPWSEGTIHTWFGEGERYPDAYAAILSIRDQCCSY